MTDLHIQGKPTWIQSIRHIVHEKQSFENRVNVDVSVVHGLT